MKYYLAHYGIPGQKKGVRHGPPYPLDSNASRQAKRKAASKSSYDKLYGVKKGTSSTATKMNSIKNKTKEILSDERTKKALKIAGAVAIGVAIEGTAFKAISQAAGFATARGYAKYLAYNAGAILKAKAGEKELFNYVKNGGYWFKDDHIITKGKYYKGTKSDIVDYYKSGKYPVKQAMKDTFKENEKMSIEAAKQSYKINKDFANSPIMEFS